MPFRGWSRPATGEEKTGTEQASRQRDPMMQCVAAFLADLFGIRRRRQVVAVHRFPKNYLR